MSSADLYNKVLSKYIEAVADSEQVSDHSKNEMIPFYTFLIVGHDSMCETYAKVLTMITDDSRIQ